MTTAIANPAIAAIQEVPVILADEKRTTAQIMGVLPGGCYLFGFYTEKQEHHNYSGKLGGQSNSPLVDAKGNPQQVYVIRTGKLCAKHEIGYLDRYHTRCPLCEGEE